MSLSKSISIIVINFILLQHYVIIIYAQDNNIFLYENIDKNCVDNKYFDVFFLKCSLCDPKLNLESSNDCKLIYLNNFMFKIKIHITPLPYL